MWEFSVEIDSKNSVGGILVDTYSVKKLVFLVKWFLRGSTGHHPRKAPWSADLR